ncbi:MAG TPA: hypothetical protein VF995_01665 [Actinomycetota bacterium]
MGTPPPRHLAHPQGRSGLSRRQRATAGVALAVTVAVALAAVALTRVPGSGPARHASPRSRPGAAAGTAPGTGDTFPPMVAMPGNLLDNGDVEGGLSGWSPLGGAALARRSPGHSGRWALAFGVPGSTTSPAPAPGAAGAAPGVRFADVTTSQAGRTYQATAWVRADRPGTTVAFALRELPAQRSAPASADVLSLTLPADGSWRQIAVVHQARMPGARVVLDLAATRLPGGQVIADQLDVEISQS